MSILPNGVYTDPETPWWTLYNFGTPANLQVSTLTVNSLPAGNILLTHNVSSGTEYNAPLIFQRPPADINAPSESLVMNTSLGVPTKPVDGEYITATKAAGTVYDDIAVAGLQIYGDQTTAGNAGAVAYITGQSGNLILAPQDSVYISSLFVSTLTATNIVSTTATTGTSLTLTSFLSSASVTTGIISTNSISTSQIVSKDIFASTLTVSTLNAPNFTPAQVSTIVVDTQLTLTSTLTLLGVSSVNLGLGDVIQGLIGGAASQGLGAVLGGAALATGAAALITARTSGGVNNNVFQTVNGSTQLQFSTIGVSVSSVFLTVNSPNPLTTPGLEISTTQGVAAGTYCVRSVGDPLYITNNVSSIQMYGQWVPVIQPTATLPAVAISSLGVSSINGATYPPPGGGGIPSTIAASTITIDGNLTQSGTGTFNWGGNTMSGTQVVLNRATSVNNTLTTSGAAFLNASATVNSGLTVASGNTIMNGSLTVNSGTNLYGGVNVVSGNLTLNQFGAIVGASVLAASQNIRTPALSTINISTGNINVSSVNGAAYPPAGATIPSTIFLSTVSVNGGLTNTGTAPIITNALSSFTLSTGSLFVSSVNGVIYPPPAGTPTIPSTIALSTVTVNGGQNITNGGLIVAGGVTVNSVGLVINNGGLFVNNATNLAGGLTASGTATFQNQVNMLQNASVNGNLVVNNGANLSGGVTLPNGNFTMNQFGASANVPILNATATVRSPAISTINISTANINVSSVNGATYPPPGGGGIPSTLNASTLTVNGGQTITNGSLIVTGGISVVNGGLSVNSGNVLIQDPTQLGNTLLVSGVATLNGGINTPALSTNTISTATITANALSTNTISSASLSVSSINGVVFPQTIPGIPSTLNASTINVNGGINIANGGIINNSFEPIRTGFLSTNFISTSLIRADTVQAPIFNTNTLSTNLIRAAAVSTIFLSSQTTTAGIIGCFQFSSLTGSINFITTSTIQALSTISVPRLDTSEIFTNNLLASNAITSLVMTTSNINLSSVNGAAYPPPPVPSPFLVPTGSVTVWAGGSDGGSSVTPQNFAVPTGWLACDGRAVSQLTDNALYLVIGNKYSRGVTPPVANFFLPDLTFAVPMGTPYRNYNANFDLSKPNFQVQFQTWPSTYVANPVIQQCWKITQTIGGTLNLGTVFIGSTISFGPWPDMYVSQILDYDGFQGYIIVTNYNNVTQIPSTGGATLTATAIGVVDRFPPNTGDFIYTLGTPGVFGRNTVTHNQTALEAAVHTHGFGSGGVNGPSLVVLAGSIGGPVLPTGAQTSPPNTLSTISTLATGPPGFETTTNIGTYTAPNFINMLYIIKT